MVDIKQIEEKEKRETLEALKKTQGNLSEAAKGLGVSRASFYRRIKSYAIDPTQFKPKI